MGVNNGLLATTTICSSLEEITYATVCLFVYFFGWITFGFCSLNGFGLMFVCFFLSLKVWAGAAPGVTPNSLP